MSQIPRGGSPISEPWNPIAPMRSFAIRSRGGSRGIADDRPGLPRVRFLVTRGANAGVRRADPRCGPSRMPRRAEPCGGSRHAPLPAAAAGGDQVDRGGPPGAHRLQERGVGRGACGVLVERVALDVADAKARRDLLVRVRSPESVCSSSPRGCSCTSTPKRSRRSPWIFVASCRTPSGYWRTYRRRSWPDSDACGPRD